MKQIFTSNYARNGKNPSAVAISVFAPKWYVGKHLKILAPTWEIVKNIKDGVIDEVDYTKQYLKILQERELTPDKIINLIPDRSILLCYESPGDFCHRRVLAEWVFRYTGFEIPELLDTKIQTQNKTVDSLLDFK